MINPNDVNLIIFDMDGTIVSSIKPVYEAIKRAFAKLGWPVDFTEADIEKYFGMAGGQLYSFILPAECPLSQSEVRNKLYEEYNDTFEEFARAFPGVRETLAALRERGYRLALYSNSSVRYFDIVISTLGVRDCFDYLECIGENGLNKTELVQKIRGELGGLTAAVVGDRHHDIETAAATGSLSVGVLFGYGHDEPYQADVTIKEFPDLLTVFDRKLPI